MPREAPFSEIHLENMLRLARIGALIMAANPGFYHRPYSVEQIFARILDHLGMPQDLLAPWGRDKVSAEPCRTVPSIINV